MSRRSASPSCLLKNGEMGAGPGAPVGRPTSNLCRGGSRRRPPQNTAKWSRRSSRRSARSCASTHPLRSARGFLREHFHQGDLDFKGAERARLLDILGRVPAIVVIHLDRPAVIPEIASQSAALLAEFGGQRRGRARCDLWPLRPDGQAAVRNAFFDGGGTQPEAGRATRFGGTGLSVRAWVEVLA